jgi:hypothetical protein
MCRICGWEVCARIPDFKYDIVGIAISLAVVFGLAVLILVFRDKVTLKPNMSPEERDTAIAKRSKRLHRGWATALFIIALLALPVPSFTLTTRPAGVLSESPDFVN